MALTPMQARDIYLVDSMVNFISRAMKSAYDAEVSSTSFPQKLRVRVGKPDDRDVVLNPPVIAVDSAVSTEADRFFEVGTMKSWRHYTFVIYAYPALNSDGSPSLTAADLMKSYLRGVFAGEFIRVLDYSNGAFNAGNQIFASDGMYITRFTDPMDRGKDTTLAQERHRFDMHVSVRVPVAEVVTT